MVPYAGRQDLRGLQLHGRSLADHARDALDRAGLSPAGVLSWADLRDLEATLVVHDPLCPLTPASFLKSVTSAGLRVGIAHVGVHPVTDTIKLLRGEVVGATVDRDLLHEVTSPLVLPASVIAALSPQWDAGAPPARVDLVDLAALLRAREALVTVEAPPLGRRVHDPSAVMVLEAFEELHPA